MHSKHTELVQHKEHTGHTELTKQKKRTADTQNSLNMKNTVDTHTPPYCYICLYLLSHHFPLFMDTLYIRFCHLPNVSEYMIILLIAICFYSNMIVQAMKPNPSAAIYTSCDTESVHTNV